MKVNPRKLLSLFLVLVMATSLFSIALAEDFTGTATGFNGDVTVTLSIEDGKITAVTAAGDGETQGIGTLALEKMPEAMVAQNAVEVDIITGATVTSNAVLEAAAAALAAAGLTNDDLEKVDPATDVPAKELAFTDPDVIVIGAGFSGMNATVAAADAGAKVYLIEKNNAIGGSIRYAGGTTSGAGTQMQKDAGVEDSPEMFQDDILRMGGGTNVPELTKKHTEVSASAIDWLDSIGVDFGDRQPVMSGSYDAFNIPREYRVTGSGNGLVAAVKPLLDKHIEDGKVELMLETEVGDIIIEDGAVVGVVLKDGTEYRAPSIVLATGGYGHNEDLIKRYNFDHVLTVAPSFATGDGFTFAEKAGAVFNNMDYLPPYPGGVPISGFDLECSATVVGYPGVIWVGNDGKRLVAEIDALDSERKAAYGQAPENLVYILLTQEMKDTQAPILKFGGAFGGAADEGWVRFDTLLEEGNCVYKGDTIEELAANAGIDADALKATIETYNGYVEAGEDKDFGRPAESMVAFAEGPYYAVKTVPYVMLTKGGPLMTVNAETTNADGEPIPGLFQCGELIGGANIGGSANIGGLANTICVVWGRTAGESAATYALDK